MNINQAIPYLILVAVTKGVYSNIFSDFGTVQYQISQYSPPLLTVLAIINTKNNGKSNKQMSTELVSPVSPKVELDLQEVEEEDKTTNDIEQEIECPRCHDIMTLSSDFDKLLYVCQECDLLLMMK